jgi:glycyl-tRNA synthetase beta chain
VSTQNLLVELFVEELPPKALKKLGEAFGTRLAEELVSRRALEPEDADRRTWFASPRRLAVHVPSVRASAPDVRESKKLMPLKVAQTPEGTWSPAFIKKLRSLGYTEGGVPDADLVIREEGGAEQVFLNQVVKGLSLEEALEAALKATVAALPIPKVMRYQLADGWTSVDFVRPAHGLVALHGTEVKSVSVLGLQAGRRTHGHRFEARVSAIDITHADSYAQQLRDDGAVIASFAERRTEIVRQLGEAAAREGLQPIDDEALLDEVTALVERPSVLLCRFEPEFLAVPQECLILTMKANQKYFPLLDASGRLTERFLIVSNIRPDDASRVIQGNERVVRPRLADAKFFFDQDRKRTLESRVPQLARVVYHGKLGTQGERVERVRALARSIGDQLGGPALAAQADRAALLAKADLVTDMVGEFPELQGVMGGYYARHDGEPEAVAFAIEDHYRPRYAGDALPRGEAGLAVALADKLETLAGLFGIGQVPSGDKDPFALRRHALGVIRMLVERELPLAVPALVDAAFGVFPAGHGDAREALQHFVYERLVGYLREGGYSAQEVDAVIAVRPQGWGQLPRRLAAVRAFGALPEAAPLAAANKRVGNILKKSAEETAARVDPALLTEPAEQALAAAVAEIEPGATAAYERGDYTASLQALAALKVPVDRFFDAVMVNAEDPALRRNRLALLASLHGAMNRVADLSRLAA